jgi:hypothetical protein
VSFQELPEGEWFCGRDCKHIHCILSLLVANGPEPLADSIISKVLKTRPQFDNSDGTAESGSGGFEWQLLHGRGGDPANGKTLAEAVQIFSVSYGFNLTVVYTSNYYPSKEFGRSRSLSVF